MVNGKPIQGADLAARIPAPWREPTLKVAQTLGEAGHRAWVVGGTVRDLILGRPIKDVDIVSDALPDRVEGLFEKTIPVGKAFGIIVVVVDGLEMEVATFREETGYSDQRRPDSITYAADCHADARRRDFTCNALFLDPLDGTIEDPTGGIRDLQAGQLRAVGKAADRFREDGLRLLRMARFAAGLGLDPTPELLEAAAAERESLAGVSPERVLGELQKMFLGGRSGEALRLMDSTGQTELCLPGWGSGDFSPLEQARRLRMLQAIEGPISTATGLAILLGDADMKATVGRITALRASKELREESSSLWVHSDLLESWASELQRDPGWRKTDADAEERGRRVLVARMKNTKPALEIASARAQADGRSTSDVDELRGELLRRDSAAPIEPVVLSSRRLMELGVPRGPALGLAIARVRAASLGRAFDDEAGAERWLLQVGIPM